jgi:cytosine/adenosine deaminase-related metal-dependent hydrolase
VDPSTVGRGSPTSATVTAATAASASAASATPTSATVVVSAVAGGPEGLDLPAGPSAWALDVVGGVIAAVRPVPAPEGRLRVLVPALTNGHDHGRGPGTQRIGVRDAPLEAWIPAFLAATAPGSQHRQVALALDEMRAGGIGAVNLCVNPTTADRDGEIRIAVAAAREAGIRAVIGVPIHTTGRGTARAGAERTAAGRREAELALDAVDALAEELEGDGIAIAYHPVGPQWVSQDVLASCAERSAATGRVVHLHLLETAPQRRWADQTYPAGIVAGFDELGLLSPRLVLAHGVHLRPAELALIAARGTTVVTNPSSNLRLASGLPPLEEMSRAGVRVAVGLDGMALDDDVDMWRELRLVRGLWQAQRQDAVEAADVLAAATAAGAAGLGAAAPEAVRVGSRADFAVHDLSSWRAVAGLPQWPAAEIVLAGASRNTVEEVWSRGRRVAGGGIEPAGPHPNTDHKRSFRRGDEREIRR